MTTKSEGKSSLIPESYLDYPSQRLYTISLLALCQTVKLTDFIRYVSSSADSLSLCGKWLLFDTLFITALAFLRIPRLDYSKPILALIFIGVLILDGLLFGGLSVHGPVKLFGSSDVYDQYATTSPTSLLEYIAPFSLALLPASWTGSKDAHLLGQHTVRMSPISTAKFNPASSNFCLSPSSKYVWIPILLNNTEVSALRYTHTHLVPNADGSPKVDRVDMFSRELKSITSAYHEMLQKTRPVVSTPSKDDDDYDEYDDDEAEDEADPHSNLQKTQTMVYLRISKPGIIQLEQVIDTSSVEARISASEVVVVPCPSVAFVDDAKHQKGADIQCAGQDANRELKISVSGVPPLSLRWWKSVDGHREPYLVEGIEGDHPSRRHSTDSSTSSELVSRRNYQPQTLQIPLTLTFNHPGTYVYGLEEIIDGVGNAIRLVAEGSSVQTNAPTRSFVILKRPSVVYSQCSLERPQSLLIGSETTLNIKLTDASPLDGPWDVSLAYRPLADDSSTKDKPYNKILKTQGDRQDLSLPVGAPGEYTIAGIKGKYCTGTVLSPNVCKVVQRPRPSAEIEWKRIHECSGDTGVSASLILRGTPPFQVSYRVQRDNEPPREFTKTFSTSRGEITIQPERSGHYIFTFVRMSDANYRKVDLQGPTIEQIIHPLASADFSETHQHSRGRAAISSCSGDTVDVSVSLKGTGPWNLEVQVIGPQSSDIINFENIETAKKTLKIPIPPSIARDGGNFEVNLVSVEDLYKCKRPVSVPGVTVNVRRTRPTARFNGNDAERRVAVTENERAKLPLRLTGSSPWTVVYQRVDSDKKSVKRVNLFNPNDWITVEEKGTYELIKVEDSQCPGSIAEEAKNFRVDWIPRPTAKLSVDTKATYVVYNHSFILNPVCEGISEHVDLDLTGRPPFQIMYNIAQGTEQGGTRMLDQPTMNSIQSRTRFQLHTSTPGRMFYEVKQIGDSMYPLDPSTVIPRLQRLLFEQHVSRRPSAHFKNRNRMTYCLNDAFTPLDASSSDGVVVLEGTPPFSLTLSIKNVASSHVQTMTVEVPSNVWKLDLPSYIFNAIGPHRITIDSVSDSSNCAQSALDPLLTSTWVDVAETAAIIPFDHKPDLCVGDVSQFQLEGIPPWTVGYKVNGKSYTKEVKTSPFSLVQQVPGEFMINSIAHQQQMCKAVVTDLRFKVHSLPSAQVGHGKKVYQDIHEGDQAEIVFTLIGEPPFTFTYQRSEPTPKKGGKPGRVLETHTVSRVMTHEYSIFSALEGTWTITSISDKYCRYPPVQQELGTDKQKR